jgi:predicted metal-dependent peptidase
MPRKKRATQPARDLASENFAAGEALVGHHPMFEPMWYYAHVLRHEGNRCPADGWAVVTSNGEIHVHPTRRGTPEEWSYVLAHCLLHLGFGHGQRPAEAEDARLWNAACDLFLADFQRRVKLGRPPMEMSVANEGPLASTERRIYELLRERGLPAGWQGCGAAGARGMDLHIEPVKPYGWLGKPVDWSALFGQGVAAAVVSAVRVAAGEIPSLSAGGTHLKTPATRAREWFINSYPLLGALAATFKLIEDPRLCQLEEISVAAVNPERREIYMNPAATNPPNGMTEEECRFVMALELLHVGLRHDARRQGRDPFLWNVACDYVINGWLVEMRVGEMPKMGLLYDPALKGESAEGIYDRMVTDMRRYRRLATLRGVGVSDILEGSRPDWWQVGAGVDLDAFYRGALGQGLTYHQEQGRGLLPAGLVQEIEALAQPPVPWDVELARWFDHYFPPVERVRSYARPSRHQSSTPDIPRPRWVPPPDWEDARTFGVVLDTSGSMSRELLAKALGAIASYSLSREVPWVRVVFCDAATYDQGYMRPEDIAREVRVRGRGGTVLQPAIDLLEGARDFPAEGPVLLITDGQCDRLSIHREHAFLLPEGRSLPFVARGPVFRMR